VIGRLFKSTAATDYQTLSEEMYEAKQQETATMSASAVRFSVGPNPEGEGAVIFFTMSNGLSTTITMPPEKVRQLIDLLAVVVPEDTE
jgi:hypothetical protein